MGLFDFIFGKSTPKYPFVTNDMLQPVGATLNREAETMAAAKAALAAFKKCKRVFLIDYINQELHGDSDQGRSGDA